MIPQSYIDELLEKTNIIHVIEQAVQLNKKGDNYWACCPFHNESTPSFSVSEKKQFYYCFGCKRSGHAIRFMMDYYQKNFLDTIQSLAELCGLPVPSTFQHNSHEEKNSYELLEAVTNYYQQALRKQAPAIQWLKKRGISGSTAQRYRLGSANHHWDALLKKFYKQKTLLCRNGLVIKHNKTQRHYDRFRHRILFPIRDLKGRVVGFGGRIIEQGEPKYLNSPESKLFHKKRIIYGLYEALSVQTEKKISELTLVEGYMDVLSLAQNGYQNAVACMGTSLSEHHIHLLKRYTQKIIFCFDGDLAGKMAAFKTIELLLKHDLITLDYHFALLSDGLDPDAFIYTKGLEAFKKLLKNALSFDDMVLRYLSHHYNTNTLQGKAGTVEKSKQILGKISNPTLRALLLEKISLLCHIHSDQLKRLCLDKRPFTLPQVQVPQNVWHKTIAYLIMFPTLAQLVPNTITLSSANKREATDLYRLIEIILRTNLSYTQQLINISEAHPFLTDYLAFATWQPLLSETQIRTEFLNCLERCHQHLNQENINILIRLSRQRQLKTSEKQTLSKLISEQKQLSQTASSENLLDGA